MGYIEYCEERGLQESLDKKHRRFYLGRWDIEDTKAVRLRDALGANVRSISRSCSSRSESGTARFVAPLGASRRRESN